MAVPYKLTADGVESQMATNHLGPHYFTTLLVQCLKDSAPSRVIFTSSYAHQFMPTIDFDLLTMESPPWEYAAIWKRYGRSKLANVLCARSWSRKLEGVSVFAVHPGYVDSELQRNMDEWWINRKIGALANRFIAYSTEDGSLTTLFTATDPRALEFNGQYFVPLVSTNKGSAVSNDKNLEEKLWQWSNDIIREKVTEPGNLLQYS